MLLKILMKNISNGLGETMCLDIVVSTVWQICHILRAKVHILYFVFMLLYIVCGLSRIYCVIIDDAIINIFLL